MNSINENNLKLGIIGYPLSHTLSPQIHEYWLKLHRISGTYETLEVDDVGLDRLLCDNVHLYRGLNVTIPHKVRVFDYMDEVSDSARVIGAINCITVENKKLIGYNTDADGFMNGLTAFNRDLDFSNMNVLVIGAGGASRAVIYSFLMKSTGQITVTNRSSDRLASLEKVFNDKIRYMDWQKLNDSISQFNLIINCTSQGMKGKNDFTLDFSSMKQGLSVIDLVYNPLETKLLSDAKSHGCQILNGVPMLLYQIFILIT
jgi:shikimate dehydrogenase